MRLTLYKYIAGEIWPSFLAALLLTIFIVLATKMLSITELVVSRGVSVSHVFGMVVYLLPEMILFALPAASLIAVTVAFLRLSADNEIIAIKSCGVSVYQMLPPVAALSVVAFLLALLVGIFGVSWGNRSFKNLLFTIAQTRADLGIKERVFSEPFEGVVFYVSDRREQSKIMKDVFVMDRRDRKVTHTIVAQEAMILSHPGKRVLDLHFTDGTIFVVEKDLNSSRTVNFRTYDLNLNLEDVLAALAGREKKPKEMHIGKLIEGLRGGGEDERRHDKMVIELMERVTIPLAVLLMGIIGVPLGAQLRGGGRSAGVGASLVVFLIYYMCLAGAKSLSEGGGIAPALGMWIPNLFLVGVGGLLFWAARRERSIVILPRSALKLFRSERKAAV